MRAASCARALLLGANSPYKAAPAPIGKTTVAHGAKNYWVPTGALRLTLSPIPRALWMSAGREFCAPNTTTRDPKQLLTYNTVWAEPVSFSWSTCFELHFRFFNETMHTLQYHRTKDRDNTPWGAQHGYLHGRGWESWGGMQGVQPHSTTQEEDKEL